MTHRPAPLRDPFLLRKPAIVSFSGGRTSAYMLWRIIQAYGGELPDDVLVIFANTGKEMQQTLDFVRDCGERWGVAITWVEYADHDEVAQRWRVTDYADASRAGEPFAALIRRKKMPPNVVARFCTADLKIRSMHRMLKATLGWDEWTEAVGLRADEMHRVVRIKASNEGKRDVACPLADAGITKRDVADFWSRQNFDLQLPNINGRTPHGNCDLCFLKPLTTVRAIMRDIPGSADWWVEQERRTGARWRKDWPPYEQIANNVEASADLFAEDGRATDCFCNGDS
jgi:3'-phosphoadenosine 5'-phosphosulfate sulfotransferase (PAPS reductase)/FAD synthetase